MASIMTARLPDDLHAWLKRVAWEEHRSVNAQLIQLLQQAKVARDAATA